jgi:hydroxymethylglutaryl-CoA lyase
MMMMRSSVTLVCSRIRPLRNSSFIRTTTTTTRLLFSSSTETTQDVKIVEVGPRDGLQNEPGRISTDQKVDLIQRLADEAGCSFIEAGAFVSPKWVPQMADSGEVLQKLNFEQSSQQQQQQQRPTLSCLVPNIKGLEQALQYRDKVDEIAIFGSASEGFSQRNIACSIDESMERFRAVVEMAKEHNMPVRGYVSTVIACPYDGPVAPAQVAKVVEQMMLLGCYEVSLGDTIGVGTAGTIRKMLEEVLVCGSG